MGARQAEDEGAAHRLWRHAALRSVNLPVCALARSANMQMKVQRVRVTSKTQARLHRDSILTALSLAGGESKEKKREQC